MTIAILLRSVDELILKKSCSKIPELGIEKKWEKSKVDSFT